MPQIKPWSTSLQCSFVRLWHLFFFTIVSIFLFDFEKVCCFEKLFKTRNCNQGRSISINLVLIQIYTRSDSQSMDITAAKWPLQSWSLPIPEGTGAHRAEASRTAVWITHYPRADQSGSTTTAARAKQSSEQHFIPKEASYMAQPIKCTQGF